MSKIVLDYDAVHKLVENNKKNGFFWDGHTLIKWTPSPNGYMQKNGMFRNNRWGFHTRYDVNALGMWEISDKYARFI